jgi:hypothetical protein
MPRKICLVIGVLAWISTASADPVETPAPAAPSATQTPAAATPSPSAAVLADGDKMECHVSAPPIGTRFGARRECKTRKEWEFIQHDQQQRIREMQQRALTSGVIGQ